MSLRGKKASRSLSAALRKSAHHRRGGQILFGMVVALPNFLGVRCILLVSAHRIHLGIEHVFLLGSSIRRQHTLLGK